MSLDISPGAVQEIINFEARITEGMQQAFGAGLLYSQAFREGRVVPGLKDYEVRDLASLAWRQARNDLRDTQTILVHSKWIPDVAKPALLTFAERALEDTWDAI